MSDETLPPMGLFPIHLSVAKLVFEFFDPLDDD
jgi:hypothetical protein